MDLQQQNQFLFLKNMSEKKNRGRHLSLMWSGILGGSASCLAETVTFPFDMSKTRIQIHGSEMENGKNKYGSSMLDVFRRVRAKRGLLGLFDGLKPALLRQATYGSLKIMLYERLKHHLLLAEHNHTDRSVLSDSDRRNRLTSTQQRLARISPLWRGIIAGASAGALSAGVCTPIDLIKVRMQAGDRVYKGLWSALVSVAKEGGVRGLYKGMIPTVQRATVIGVLTLPTYDMAKIALLNQEKRSIMGYECAFRDNSTTHVLASLFSGFIGAYGSMPIDVVKSRIMNQPVDPMSGRGLLYRNSWHCLKRTVQTEGLLALWKGTVANLCRSGPWVVVFWCSFEYQKRLFYAH